MTILNIEDLCFDNTTFGKPVKGNGFYSMRMTHNKDNPEPIILQTPKMALASNILDTKFVDMRLTHEEYSNHVQQIDDTLISLLKENKNEWFVGKGLTDQFIDTGYLPSLKRNGDWRMNVVSDELAVYDDNKQPYDVTNLVVGDTMRCIVQLSGLWFTNTRWGVSWKMIQLKKTKKKEIRNEYMFPDEADADAQDVIEPPPGMDE